MMRVTTGWLAKKRYAPSEPWRELAVYPRSRTRKQAEQAMWNECVIDNVVGAEYKIVRLYRRVRGVK